MPLISKGLDLVGNAALAKGKSWIKNKTGVDLDQEKLSDADYLKLKQFEMDHEEELIRLRQEDDKLAKSIKEMYIQDTQSARSMQTKALEQDDKFSKRFIYWFACVWSLFAILYVAAITFCSIPDANIRFADTILGFLLGTIVSQIIAFFYGSSKSSQGKDEVKDELLRNTLGGKQK
jgi:hypothetical protein